MRSTNYFALDLELNNKNDGSVPKIIQVGVAIGNPTKPDDIKTFNWYLNPEEPIVPFITKLTGITDEIVQTKSVSRQTLANEFGALIRCYDCFPNPVTWGQGDANELKEEFAQRNIDFPFFGRRIFDIKTIYVFNQMVNGKTPSGGLRKSMNSYGLKFQGTPHNAEYDALNTLRFFFKLLERQKQFEDYKNLMKSIP